MLNGRELLAYLLTVADMGEGGVKNGQKSAEGLYGQPPKETAIIFTKSQR